MEESHKQIKILYVEDNLIPLELTVHALERRGFFVMVYQDGDKAEEELRGGLKYDLAIIDRSVGDSTRTAGDDLAKLSKDFFPSVPVLCTSAYNEKPSYADRLLAKPFGLNELTETIEQMLLAGKRITN